VPTRQGNKIFDPLPEEKPRKRQIFSNNFENVQKAEPKPPSQDLTNPL
jgi:hypothetical protein